MLAFARLMFLVLILFPVGCQSTTTHCDLVTVDERRIEVSESALPELMDLLSHGKLSQQEVSEITYTALTIQGDLDSPWSGAWGNWIESARAQGAVSDAEFKKYAEQSASEWEFRAYRTVDMHNTGRFGLEFVLTHLGGRVASVYSPHGLEISHKIMELTVERIPIIKFDGRDGGTKSFTSATEHPGGRSWFRTPDEIPGMETLKSGKHLAIIIFEEEIYESQRPDRLLKRNRIELKDEFEYYRNLYFPEHNKQVDSQPVNPITDHWGPAFDLLDTMIVIASEAGGDFNKEIRKSPPLGKGYLIEATTRLHARACQVSSEVLTLLKGGYADGAHARWRCLHEIAVVLFFLASGEDETAERYLLHEAIESHKAALSYQEHCDCLGYKPMTKSEMAQLEQNRDGLIKRFGKDFKGNYGWAAVALGKKSPAFKDIEDAVKMSHMRPFYKMASHNVHSNPKGILFKLCLHSKNPEVLPIGPSVFGLADPGHGTAMSILQATTTLLTIEPNMDCLVACDVLRRFTNKAGEAFLKTHELLEKDIVRNKSVKWT